VQITPYLMFNGNCAEAFKFYEKVLRGKIVMSMTHGDSPAAEHVPAEMQDKVIHVRLVAGGAVLMGSDSPPEYYAKPQGQYVSLIVDSAEEAERIYEAFSEGAAVTMPLEETFWALRFAMLTDKFGSKWMINCEKPMQ